MAVKGYLSRGGLFVWVSDMRKLTPKQQRFVEEYLVDLNATQAAIRAGYRKKAAYATGAENLKKPQLSEAIQKALKKRSDRTQITTDQVIKEWAAIALSDMADYVRFGEDGNAYLDFSRMPDGATKAISEIVQDEYVEGRGENAREVKRTKFKLHSKLGALDSLAKHLGMFIERHEHTGAGGGPIQTEDVTLDNEQRNSRLEALLDRARARRAKPAGG